MRNRIEKSNKTKFDYRARVLGIIGIAIIAVTFIVGGHTLTTISNENKTLVNLIDSPSAQTKNNEKVAVENERLEIVVEDDEL